MAATEGSKGAMTAHRADANASDAICAPWAGHPGVGGAIRTVFAKNGFPVKKAYYARPPIAPEGDCGDKRLMLFKGRERI